MTVLRIPLVFACAFFAIPSLAHAKAGAATCPQYVRDTGISVTLSAELLSTVPSSPLGIHASVRNASASDAYDGSLFVRVVDTSRQLVVDEFVAKDALDVEAGAIQEADLVWRVPVTTPTGDYRIEVFYVYPSSLFVPPFGSASHGAGELMVHVDGNSAGAAHVDASHALVSGATYDPGTAAYLFMGETSVGVRLPVVNASSEPYRGTLTWRLFERGRAPRAAPVSRISQEVRLHPSGMASVEYTLGATNAASYYLEATLENGKSRSIAAIPLLRAGGCAEFPVPAARDGRAALPAWVIFAAALAALLGGIYLLRASQSI